MSHIRFIAMASVPLRLTVLTTTEVTGVARTDQMGRRLPEGQDEVWKSEAVIHAEQLCLADSE
jgi:hypothetical protein